MASVRFENVSISYGAKQVVKDFSLSVNDGEIMGIIGPSGCGKTTLIRALCGLIKPDKGSIYIADQLVFSDEKRVNIAPERRGVGVVFQDYAVWPHLSVWDNVCYPMKKHKVPKEEIAKRAAYALEQVRMTGYEKHMPAQLSGGQQQRVALARALVVEPGVLLFDEPLSNLDARLRVHMRTEIRKIQQKLGITALYVTHDQAEAMSLSDRIIILKDGVIEQVGSPSEIYHHPANRFVANFVGTANFIDGVICGSAEGKVDVNVDGTIYHGLDCREVRPEGSPCTIVVRPESLSLSKGKGLPCKVTLSTFMGEYQYYEASYKNDTLQIHQSNPKAKAKFDVGESAYIQLDAADLFVIY